MNEEFIIKKLLKSKIKGVDNYKHNGSTWLIFTSEKKWVIELTKEGTLWYNHFFFKEIFDFVGLDVVENQHYITKWVEDNIINGVKHLRHRKGADDSRAENIIQNGVKDTSWDPTGKKSLVEDTIQNGVIHTIDTTHHKNKYVEDTIQNGVKETHRDAERHPKTVEDTIQNGVKSTRKLQFVSPSRVEDTVINGVKYTGGIGNPMWMGGRVEDTIQNGVIHTKVSKKVRHFSVEDTIQNGVKHTEYGDWLDGDERFDDIIDNGIKETTPGGYLGSIEMKGKIVHQLESPKQNNEVEDVIQQGVKKTNWRKVDNHPTFTDNVIERGEKC